MESKRSVLFKVSTILKKKLESEVRHLISLTKEVFYLRFNYQSKYQKKNKFTGFRKKISKFSRN